jgi:LysM repeat protein
MPLLDMLKKHSLIVIIGLLVLAGGIVFVAAVFSIPRANVWSDPLTAAYTVRTNLKPPANYTVIAGDTMYDVARKLGIPFYDIVIENHLSGELPLMAGSVLKIPNYANVQSTADRPQVVIKAERDRGSAPFLARLTSDFAFTASGCRFVWDLGNNRFSFQARPEALYLRPGRFPVRFITVDGAGRYASSNMIALEVNDLPADYEGLPYLTADRVGDFIDVTGRLKDAFGGTIDFDSGATVTQSPVLLEYCGVNRLIARDIGYSRVKLEKNGHVFEFYLFVSPLPARLSAEPEYDWYKTQFNTGMYGNCGPAAIDSGIKWATGRDFPVEAIRAEIGMPYHNGAVDHRNLLANLKLHAAPSAILPFNRASDILDVIDQGGIVIISFNCGAIHHTLKDKATDFFDRYYPDATGHYLLIRGYSLDRRYFIVYDAIPGEWKNNEPRYLDGVSMIGRNRFFLTDEVMNGIGTHTMLAVYRRGSIQDIPPAGQ